ncbi:MAG: class I SAM-dependent methyltransferase [Planctomycetaceae bacterium]|nr:class I SAM-dependent methyltransferase [Planctomycetaceae bacterium]
MAGFIRDKVIRPIYEHRARWTLRRLRAHIKSTDHVLDIGAGDCRVDELLQRKVGCQVTPVDVEDFNTTSLPLTMFDGTRLPFEDNSFDVSLVIFVLHHAQDPRAVLAEARRVTRRHVIVFEDVNTTTWDRWTFRSFHRLLEWSEHISRPFHEWTPEQWTALAEELGYREDYRGLAGRQLGPLASRHVQFVWHTAKQTAVRNAA